jgi:hypothetical protein
MATNFVEVKRKPFFYDAQIARVLIQVGAKCFGGYQVSSGYQTDGKIRMTDVPAVFSGWSRMTQQMFGGISDNTVLKMPIMSYALNSLQRKDAEMRDPRHIQQHVIRTRKRDADGNLLINEPGELIVVERYMPVPYEMDIELAIWASNYDQLNQLVEQIGSQFNPDQEIEISNSPSDWTSPTRILHNGNVAYDETTPSERPDPAMIARLSFIVTTRLSLPVRVYDATLIHEIDVNFRELEDFGYMYFGDNIDIPGFPLLNELVIIATPQEIIDHEG